jgi:hypothetical protein
MAYSIRCVDAGMDCPGSFTTETKEELMKTSSCTRTRPIRTSTFSLSRSRRSFRAQPKRRAERATTQLIRNKSSSVCSPVAPTAEAVSRVRQSATASDSREADRTAFATDGRTCQNKVNDGQRFAKSC